MSDRQEKVFDPTPQRLQKAREEGNVFRSQEILSVGILTGAVAMLFWGMPHAFDQLKLLMQHTFLSAPHTPLTLSSVQATLGDISLRLATLLLPFFAGLMILGITLNVLQTGWNVSAKPLQPRTNRISPLQGFKRIFSSKGLFQFVKALIKIMVVGPLAYLAVRNHLAEILMLHTLPLPTILTTATGWILVLVTQMIGALLLLSGLDFAFEKWKYKQDLKMSKQEVEDEQKEQEGSPHVKGKRRELARALARRPRLDHAVLKSDVVIANPTHYAVALRYDPEAAAAPVVLAKGIRKRALRIKELARQLEVPTVENRLLARALYAQVPEEQEIPEELYPAVAAILAEIYRERGRM